MSYAINEQGYLENSAAWDEHFALNTADELGIELTEAHWHIIRLSRTLVLTDKEVLGLKKLIEILRNKGIKANSLYIQRLFPGHTIQLIAKVAGLKKPAQCL